MQRDRMQISLTSKWNKLGCHRCFRALLLSLLQDKQQQAARHGQVHTAARIRSEKKLCQGIQSERKLTGTDPMDDRLRALFSGSDVRRAQRVRGRSNLPVHAHHTRASTQARTHGRIHFFYCSIHCDVVAESDKPTSLIFYHLTNYVSCQLSI